jgi:hypothetical protein
MNEAKRGWLRDVSELRRLDPTASKRGHNGDESAGRVMGEMAWVGGELLGHWHVGPDMYSLRGTHAGASPYRFAPTQGCRLEFWPTPTVGMVWGVE